MSGRFMDLRPAEVRRRVQEASERVRVGRLALVAGAMLSVAWAGGAWRLSSARAEHREATRIAENVVRLEAELSAMRSNLQRTGRELGAWRRVTLPFETGDLVDAIVSDLPPSATLERLDLDAGSLVAAGGTGFRRAEEAPRREVEGDIEGFAASDEAVAVFVDALRRRPFMSSVRVVTTRHRELPGDGEVARAFRLAFTLDLAAASPAPRDATDSADGGDA